MSAVADISILDTLFDNPISEPKNTHKKSYNPLCINY